MNFGTKHVKIFIYPGDHPPPHCHVLRGGIETRVAIPTLLILSGPKLNKVEEEMILDQLDEMCAEFDRLNPILHKKETE